MRAPLIWIVAFPLASVATGCSGRPTTDAHGTPPAGGLAGTWDVAFDLERSPLIAWSVADTARVRGRFVLLPDRTPGTRDARIESSDYGSYDIDFTPFGFDPREAGVTPTVLASWMDADSVRILLDPASTGTSVVMRGVVDGGVVSGRWDVTLGRGAGGGGRFRMVRPQR